MRKTLVVSVGGSLINPGEIQVRFLRKLKEYVLKSSHKFILICGGGALARQYSKAGKMFKLNTEERDEVGIATTLVNAEFVRHIFKADAVEKKPVKKKFKKVYVTGGWKPGASSDYDAILWAHKNGSREVINLTNVDYVYDKDPKKKGAKPLEQITWDDYRQIIGDKWEAGLHTPFDPVAAKTAQKWKMKVVCMNGRKLANFDKYLRGEKFVGTIIE